MYHPLMLFISEHFLHFCIRDPVFPVELGQRHLVDINIELIIDLLTSELER